MKKIYPLNISRLTNKQHFTFMQLALAACTLYAIVAEEFARLVEAFRWVDVPEFMPDHDITIYAQYVG